MREFLQSILGNYNPVTYTTYEYVNEVITPIEVIPNGVAGVDWLYILSGLAFLIVIYSVFRVLGGLICNRM